MTERDQPITQSPDHALEGTTTRPRDDRRREVKPIDRPVPQSPEPEEDSVRKGQEKLERVKPY